MCRTELMSARYCYATTPLETASTFCWLTPHFCSLTTTLSLISTGFALVYSLIFPQSWDSTLYLKKKNKLVTERNVWQCFNWRLSQPFTFWQVLILSSHFANALPQLEDPRWTIWLLQINGIVTKDIPAYHKRTDKSLFNRKKVFWNAVMIWYTKQLQICSPFLVLIAGSH